MAHTLSNEEEIEPQKMVHNIKDCTFLPICYFPDTDNQESLWLACMRKLYRRVEEDTFSKGV